MSFARMTLAGATIVLTALSAAAWFPGVSATMQESVESQEWPSRTPDGQPDMQGMWAAGSGGATLFLEPFGYLMSIGAPPPQLSTSLLNVVRPPPVTVADGGPPPLNQATILDHNRSPRNFGPLERANRSADGDNPICGDRLTVQLEVDEDGRVADVRFHGKGCAISTASASLMTESVTGRTREQIDETFARFHALVTIHPEDRPGDKTDAPGLGKLAVFSGVREYPVRVKCATLAWHTLRSALDQMGEVARTE